MLSVYLVYDSEEKPRLDKCSLAPFPIGISLVWTVSPFMLGMARISVDLVGFEQPTRVALDIDILILPFRPYTRDDQTATLLAMSPYPKEQP